MQHSSYLNTERKPGRILDENSGDGNSSADVGSSHLQIYVKGGGRLPVKQIFFKITMLCIICFIQFTGQRHTCFFLQNIRIALFAPIHLPPTYISNGCSLSIYTNTISARHTFSEVETACEFISLQIIYCSMIQLMAQKDLMGKKGFFQ